MIARDVAKPKPTLLHNMSVPPKTLVKHQPRPGRTFGVGIVFEIPALPGRSKQALTVAELRTILGLRASRGVDREQQLRDKLHRIAADLPLPASAIVTAQKQQKDRECFDVASALAVISKSSPSVYLRDKEPNLTRLVPGTRVVVIVPKEFANEF